jgi:sulfonate transport system substrate-binding protein
MINRRQLFPLLAGAAGAVTLPLTFSPAKAATGTLRIGWQKGGAIALAKAQGALEKRLAGRGIEVTWSEFTSGPPLLEALGAGAIDFGPTGDVPPLFAHAAGGDLVYAAAVKGGTGSAILVRKNSPIASLADLKGKRVAFKRGSSSHNFTVKALRKAGLTLQDITEVDLTPSDAAAAFATDQIDAWTIWDPFYAIAEKDPDTRVLVTTDGIVDSWSYLLANGEFARTQPDVLAEVIDELRKVGTWSQEHLEDTITAISGITGVPRDVQSVALKRKGSDLGRIEPVSAEVLAYQQELADEFFNLKIIPRKLSIADVVWVPPKA